MPGTVYKCTGMNLLGVEHHVMISIGYGSRLYVDAKKARQEARNRNGHVYLKATKQIKPKDQ